MDKQIKELLDLLTLEEKIDMIHGAGLFRNGAVERLDIPSLVMSDGPMGVRAEFADNEWKNIGNNDDYTSYLPCNSAIASTWNTKLSYCSGKVLGSEARARGKDIILAPGINIKRSPLCGRNFEYMSEDPRLIEELVVPMVKGIQSNDVAACVKHFACNLQETQRLSVDTIVDEETLFEIYFPGFKAAIEKGGIFSLMGAYNKVNGEFSSMSQYLLNHVLREMWKFDGMIVSDWGAIHDTDKAALSSLDIEMDVKYDFNNHFMADKLLEKVKNGTISEEKIDEKVTNILRLMYRLKMIGENKKYRKKGSYNTKENQDITLNIARESLILLKNDEKVLPLNIEDKYMPTVAVIGLNATKMHSNGGGSSEIKALYEITPLLGIKKLLGGNARVLYAPGYYDPKITKIEEINWQASSTNNSATQEDEKDFDDSKIVNELRNQALQLASKADFCIFVGGLNHDFDSEGIDRKDMKLPYYQDELIEGLLSINPNTVITLYAGSPVEMPWVNKAKAILWSYYNGMEGGTAIAETIFGEVNPSGRLAETFIKDISANYPYILGEHGKEDKIVLKDKLFVGYRYYDSVNSDVLFPFGHGLSYSNFEYSNLSVSDCDNNNFIVRFEVTNNSKVIGKEVSQIYISPVNKSEEFPTHELKAFEKFTLNAGETKIIEVNLSDKDFSHYNSKHNDFIVYPGNYTIQVGMSSRNIKLCQEITVK